MWKTFRGHAVLRVFLNIKVNEGVFKMADHYLQIRITESGAVSLDLYICEGLHLNL